MKITVYKSSADWFICLPRGSGGGVSESMDRRGCDILAFEVAPKNLIFA